MSDNFTKEELQSVEIDSKDLPTAIENAVASVIYFDQKAQECAEKSLVAKEIADKQITAKSINHKDAINSTQDAVRAVAEAQVMHAEAQKELFLNQQKMAEGMRFLLMLGTSNLSATRQVIQALESKLKQAETEKLSQSAREELNKTLQLLREQESAFVMQDRLASQIKETKCEVVHQSEIIAEIKAIDEIQTKTDARHDKLLAETEKKDAEQDEQLKQRAQKDKAHDEGIKQAKVLGIIGVGLGAIALILGILAIII